MLGYYGGKYWLHKKLKNINIPIREGFVDVFTGGGSMIDFAYPMFKKLVVNDIDEPLINFYIQAKEHPTELGLRIEKMKEYSYEVTHQDLIDYATQKDRNSIDRAAYYYFGNKTCFGAKSYDTPTKEHLEEFNKKNNINVINKIHNTLLKCEINNITYQDLIPKYKGYFYFLDPPYWKVSDNNYYGINGENHKGFDHYDLFNYVKMIDENGDPFMITYEYSDVVRDLYKDYNQFKINKITTAASDDFNIIKNTPEILITNFEIKQVIKKSLL